jgi:hypothetical protein
VGRQFEASRKLGPLHQHVLVFVKGNPRTATEAIGPVEYGDAMHKRLREMIGHAVEAHGKTG